MSAADKTKLDGIQTSADAVSFSQTLTSGTEIGSITINGTATKLYCQTNTDTGATSVTTTGSGNAITSASYDSTTRKITFTKGTTFLTSHQSLANYVDKSSAQTIAGVKTFSDGIVIGTASGLIVSGVIKVDGKLQARTSSSVNTYGNGTAGQVLMSGGSSAAPYWGTVSSGSTIYAHRIYLEEASAIGYAEFILYSSSSASINTFAKLYNALVAQGGASIVATCYTEDSLNGLADSWHPCAINCTSSAASITLPNGDYYNVAHIGDTVKTI